MGAIEEIEGIFNLRANVEHVFFRSFFNRKKATDGLGHTHIITLMILNFEGPAPMSIISDRMNLEKGSFTPVANRLIEKGYIEKNQDSTDKRVHIISLTEKGAEFATNLKKEHVVFIEKLFEIFTEEEQASFFNAVDEIMKVSNRLEQTMK